MSEPIYFITQTELNKRNQEVNDLLEKLHRLEAEKANLQKLLDGAREMDEDQDRQISTLRFDLAAAKSAVESYDKANEWQKNRIKDLEAELECLKASLGSAHASLKSANEKLRERQAGVITESLYNQVVTELAMLVKHIDQWSKTRINPTYTPHQALIKAAKKAERWLDKIVPGAYADRCAEANQLRDEVKRLEAVADVNIKRVRGFYLHLVKLLETVETWSKTPRGVAGDIGSIFSSGYNKASHNLVAEMHRARKAVEDAKLHQGMIPECKFEISHDLCNSKIESLKSTNEDLSEELCGLRTKHDRVLQRLKALVNENS